MILAQFATDTTTLGGLVLGSVTSGAVAVIRIFQYLTRIEIRLAKIETTLSMTSRCEHCED